MLIPYDISQQLASFAKDVRVWFPDFFRGLIKQGPGAIFNRCVAEAIPAGNVNQARHDLAVDIKIISNAGHDPQPGECFAKFRIDVDRSIAAQLKCGGGVM